MAPGSTHDLNEIVNRLDKEPLAHLMLGNKELFHSNLLAWFFERMPEAADRVFGALTEASSATGLARKVMREKQNVDLWFQWPHRLPLLIENKVFSLPDERQLEDYVAKVAAKRQSTSLWLLCLAEPDWYDGRKQIGSHEWRCISYRDLAERIQSALPAGDLSYEAETMRRYARMVELLSELAAMVMEIDPNETVALPDAIVKALADSRLDTPMAKLRAWSVAQHVSRALDANGIEHPHVRADFTKGLPFHEWFLPVNHLAPGATAGWQLQGGQFRLALRLPHLEGNSEQARSSRREFAREHEDLFDFSYFDGGIGAEDHSIMPTQGFNRFDPDFVYRYKKVFGLTVGQLQDAAIAIARKLIERPVVAMLAN